MTRRSKRELESAIDDIDDGDDDGPRYDVVVAYRTRDGWVDADGDPVPTDATVALAIGGVSMKRQRAEREGYEILGPTESENNPDADLVTVPWDYDDADHPEAKP